MSLPAPPGAGSSPAVEAVRLTHRFESATAIEDVSFAVGPHEFVSIVGPSGCGKSTTLRLVTGLIRPTAGTVRVAGAVVDGPIRNAAMVFQAPVLLPWRRTLENILFPAEMAGIEAADCRSRALQLLRLAGLSGSERSYPHELSGGMQQRVSICRALLLNPAVLLMDEPFGALDVLTRERMGFELQQIWGATRNAVLFVTHSITEAVLLSDRVLVMSARPGRLEADVAVDLPRPRTKEMLRDGRFLELSGAVRDRMEAV